MPENRSVSSGTPQESAESSNRRIHDRFTCDVEITLESESTFYQGFTENISAGGLFVATYDVKPLGHVVHLVFSLPNFDRQIELDGEVRWVREYNPMTPDTIPGMGVRFVGISDEEKAAIEEFTAMKEPLFYDDE
jgi:uncharacterized protein (TIGR02266 family)